MSGALSVLLGRNLVLGIPIDGLQRLLVKGGRHGWPFAHRIEGKRRMLSQGTCLDTSLAAFSRLAWALRCARIDLAFDCAHRRPGLLVDGHSDLVAH